VCFHRPPQALLWFAGYVSVYALRGLFIPEQFVGLHITELQTFIQLLVLGWTGSTLLQEEKFARHTVIAFSIGTLLLATGMLLGLPGFSEMRGGRLSAVGVNPNGPALMTTLGTQALIGLVIAQTPRKIWMQVTFIAMSFVPLVALMYSGSRGAILSCVAGTAF